MNKSTLKQLLNAKYEQYNHIRFILNDPIVIPHQFSLKQDIEIAGLFAALFAWGNRTTIIQKSRLLLSMMHHSPYDFVIHHSEKDLKPLLSFKHRTFNGDDLLYIIYILRKHYQQNESLESAFAPQPYDHRTIEQALIHFHDYVFNDEHVLTRTKKHISTPLKNSSCKRLCMYLRWMVRQDTKGVDFGLWTNIKPYQLICPLDIHVSRVAKTLGLLEDTHSHWRNACHLTQALASFDKSDPVKYDFALFNLGIEEGLR